MSFRSASMRPGLSFLFKYFVLGINSFFADNGLSDVQSWLYFPADPLQMIAIVQRVFFERGLRFVFSTRSKVPYILKEDSQTKFFGDGYEFVPGKDETIVDGKAGYVVTFGEMLYRSWDAVLRCRKEGLDVGLVNKPTLNVIDEQVRFFFFCLSCYSRKFWRIDHCEDRSESICPRRRILQPKDRSNSVSFVPSKLASNNISSLDLNLGHGYLSASLRPSIATWVPPKKVSFISSLMPLPLGLCNVSFDSGCGGLSQFS